MKYYIVICSMFLSFEVNAQTFDVMTYNIRLDADSDGPDNWHHRKNDLAGYILVENPDFVGIQEALLHQTLFLDSILTDYHYIGVGRDDGKNTGEFMALFYRKPWKLLQDTTVWLSESPEKPSKAPDAGCFRTCTAGLFTKSGDTIRVFNTHFDHIGQNARLLSADIILNMADRLWKNYPLVVTGDFNITPQNPVYSKLTSSLKDVWKLHHHNETGTFNGFILNKTFSDRIDYIFMDDSLTSLSCKIGQPLTGKGRQLSDHFPVITKLRRKHE